MDSSVILSKKDKEKDLVFPPEMNSQLAYFCGVLAGDGSLGWRKKKYEYSLKCVGNPLDEKEFYIKIVSPICEEIFNYRPKVRHFDKKTTFGFRIFSKALVLYLSKEIGLPLGKKGIRLKIPTVFLENQIFTREFIKGFFDTDGCITYKKNGSYPVIALSSRSSTLIQEISSFLKVIGFSFYEVYDYKVFDSRFKKGYSLISRIEINGHKTLSKWLLQIGSLNPKHLKKIKNSGGRI